MTQPTPKKSRLEAWIEEHRELVLLGAVLPIGKGATPYQRAARRRSAPAPSGHKERVARVVADVARYADLRRRGAPEWRVMLRTDRKGTDALNTRISDKQSATRIAMHDLRAILGVNRAAGTVRVEPFATIGEVAAHLDAQGLQLEATIEMEGATMGGLVLAIGMTTHSHRCGLMEERERAMRRQVYQDFAFPAEHLRELLTHLDDTFQIYPLLVYPCRVMDRGGMVRVKGQHGVPWDGQERSAMYLNLGISGPPRAIREGDLRYPTVTKVRELEGMVRERSGFLHTYVDVLSTEQEFEAMFDHGLWREMRKRYGAEGVFPTVYEKIRPELDIQPFLAEEAHWP